MASAELQGKYQKLAQEYSKLRAQNQVLKKGVVDEQANSAALKLNPSGLMGLLICDHLQTALEGGYVVFIFVSLALSRW
uniref:Protein phosphatase 1 regulatory subunit 21 n=1 Tax=Sciurus vulgaris TaxID=55149 RepID=A0A8D2DNZ3_SCIVU